MAKHSEKFEVLTNKASNYLQRQLKYSKKTSGNHERHWRYVGRFMRKRRIKSYTEDIGNRVLQDRFGDRSLLRHEKEFYNSVQMLNELLLTGKITTFPRMERRYQNFSGIMAEIIHGFIDEKRECRMSQSSIRYYTRNLFRFNSYCNSRSIGSAAEIDLNFVFAFLKDVVTYKGLPAIPILSTLRGFVKYLHQKNLIASDFSPKIPKYKKVSQPKLPSTYTKEEIQRLITSVDRSTPIGKRDYTVVLIAARLGLRASDIGNLRFENLQWDKSIIKLNQCKTGKELILPLLPDVGNAIIDYMKFGRPKSRDSHVFLCQRPPYGCFTNSNVVTHIVQRAFLRSGLVDKTRKFGSHSLRHTLGFRMLQESTLLPVITEVFGHQSSKSTRYYLRIDLQSMKQCMLDVPPVATSFYNQKGGFFYV
jgi:integrase